MPENAGICDAASAGASPCDDEMELVERAKTDPQWFGQLYELHYSRILNYIYQTVLALRYFEDMSCDEVADVLEKKIGTVKSLIHRGLERLKRQFDRSGATFLQNLHYQAQKD